MWIRIQFFSLMLIWIWILLLIRVIGICDHWSTDPLWLRFFSLHASIVSVHGSILSLLNFNLMRIRIPDLDQRFPLM
jgi:hypothetical protein